MSTPLSTPVRQAKLGIASTKSLPLANEYKKLLNEQHQRLSLKHQQDLDLIDDIRSYVKARLSIERDYTSALSKLCKQHSVNIGKRFTLLNQCDTPSRRDDGPIGGASDETNKNDPQLLHESEASDSRLQKRLANNGLDEPDKPCSLYKVWSEHISRLQNTSKNRADQFEQLIMVVDKLKDIRSHKASIGKRCLDTHLKRIHEDVIVSMVEVEKARKLYYEDESQAKKARENEEKIKKKRSGLLTKFTDLQAKKEKTSAQREANDIQSTQARNDYIMALASANAHLEHYYQRDLSDFIHLIDDGVLDHCKIFMATLSECDINSLKDTLTHAQYWSKMINLTGSQRTNTIFLECDQSICLRNKPNLTFEPCNNDPIQNISLEHNADYALQHEVDKWFTWFKKECRNLSQLMHQLEVCQRAFSEGKKSIELNGQTTEDLEPKIIELKQQIRKSEAAKLKAQARLKAIKEGGMQIEEWSAVESEIRADMARAHEEMEAKRAKEMVHEDSNDRRNIEQQGKQASNYMFGDSQVESQVQLQVSKDSDDSDAGESIHNLASVSRSTSNLMQKQQNAMSGYSALTDPSLVWQEDYSGAWGGNQSSNYNVVVTDTFDGTKGKSTPINTDKPQGDELDSSGRYDLLGTSNKQNQSQSGAQPTQNTSMTVQSSSPLSAIVDGAQSSPSPYQGIMGEAYKSDYECDYNRTTQQMRSTASSAEPYNQQYLQQSITQADPFGKPLDESTEESGTLQKSEFGQANDLEGENENADVYKMLNRRVVALYNFDKTNEDDLAFNESDILLVLEVNDLNWVKARSEATGEEGYVPTSYIKLVDGDNLNESRDGSAVMDGQETDRNITSMDSESAWNTQDIQHRDKSAMSSPYCKAIYDYEPEDNTYEEDGLPHLALVQGELMRIIDQGEDDGWWLVEKEETKIKGHVPSMLVEEFDPNAAEEDEEEDGDGDDASEYSDDGELRGSIMAMPNFEPPVLQKSPEDPSSIADGNEGRRASDVNNNNDADLKTTDSSNEPTKTAAATSLIPTSFIIIEPTPEVESKLVCSDLTDTNQTKNSTDTVIGAKHDRQVIQGDSSKPPNDVSYSIINEEFVLEGPTRKPYHQSEQVQHHETPTIMEENPGEEGFEAQNNELSSSKAVDGNYEPLSEVDSLDMPAPPSVVIEACEDVKRERSPSLDENLDEARDSNDNENEEPPVYVQKEIKHTGNVDVNPLLRLRAEEFSKQIIAEAIMLAPGADVGPSTSFANR